MNLSEVMDCWWTCGSCPFPKRRWSAEEDGGGGGRAITESARPGDTCVLGKIKYHAPIIAITASLAPRLKHSPILLSCKIEM